MKLKCENIELNGRRKYRSKLGVSKFKRKKRMIIENTDPLLHVKVGHTKSRKNRRKKLKINEMKVVSFG